ncbi:beta-ketoacyl-ACP synthase III [Longispora sp. NPDC051575]|uniref:beta-ketoacyl-ACP synthase III n=1 Tax=Longispora sp. NPDC051575 TaxID=3154943 RepID=UPI003429FD6B
MRYVVSRPALLAGLSGWLPPIVVDNAEILRHLDSTEQWITQRTGIHRRHRAEPGTATSDLAIRAAAPLVAAARGPIDAVVVATMTPDRQCPATAPVVATGLGLTGAAAWDVANACTGFVYGLATVTAMISAGVLNRVLLIGAETMSAVLDRSDRGTAMIFGDGAGAALLEAGRPGDAPSFGPFDLGSDGTRPGLVAIPAGGSSDPDGEDRCIRMEGPSVYRSAVEKMTDSAQLAAKAADWSVADVDWFVAHQANARILDAVADRLDIPPARRFVNVDRVGNTSGASVPLALADLATSRRARAGDKVLITSFGAGLTWASTTLTWPEGL